MNLAKKLLAASRILRGGTVIGLLLLAFFASAGMADEQADRRLLMGLKLFPALVAADQDLSKKRAENGSLQVVVLFREDAVAANNIAKRLGATERIRNYSLLVSTLSYGRLAELKENPPAALFLAEWSPNDLESVIRFSVEHHRLVFSPFKGDVAAGVSAGIFISDRLLPLLNPRTLDDAGIRLQQFLLDVAKTHE